MNQHILNEWRGDRVGGTRVCTVIDCPLVDGAGANAGAPWQLSGSIQAAVWCRDISPRGQCRRLLLERLVSTCGTGGYTVIFRGAWG
jgi:hypothetical protein